MTNQTKVIKKATHLKGVLDNARLTNTKLFFDDYIERAIQTGQENWLNGCLMLLDIAGLELECRRWTSIGNFKGPEYKYQLKLMNKICKLHHELDEVVYV